MEMRSPLSRVRGLGAAHEGVAHWWAQRLTGVALAGGILVLTYWLTAATYGADAYATAMAVIGSWIGHVVLWGLLFSLYYHLANGVRHLMWDAGAGFDLPSVRRTGVLVIVFAVAMTAATLGCVYFVIGG